MVVSTVGLEGLVSISIAEGPVFDVTTWFPKISERARLVFRLRVAEVKRRSEGIRRVVGEDISFFPGGSWIYSLWPVDPLVSARPPASMLTIRNLKCDRGLPIGRKICSSVAQNSQDHTRFGKQAPDATPCLQIDILSSSPVEVARMVDDMVRTVCLSPRCLTPGLSTRKNRTAK
jgi:hypothetical protein